MFQTQPQETALTSMSLTTAARPLPAQILALVVALAICFGAAYLGQLATTPNIDTWYAGLAKPSFNPPNAIFPVVWTVLYAMMAVALWLVWRTPPSAARAVGIAAFVVQLVLNVAWSWAFFGAHSPLLGLVVIVALIAAIVWTVLSFRRTSGLAAILMLPYLVWVSFATVLNASILALN